MKTNLSAVGVVMASCLMLLPLAVLPQATQKQDAPKASTKQKASSTVDPQQGEGDRIFQQHCSRCHNAPDGFSPRISGTVVRHMRVRASISKHEEEELLRFLNP